VVRDNNVNVTGSGDYNLYFANAGQGFSIPSGDEGGALTNGGVHSGTIDLADMDLYTFQADALDNISAQLDEVGTTELSPHLLLYGPDGNLLTSGSGATSTTINHQALVAGTYTVVVRDNNVNATGSGNYELTFTLSPTATGVPAGAIIATLQNGGRFSGTYATGGDIDKFNLAVNIGDTVRLKLADTGSISNVSPGLQVFASNGSLLGSSTSSNLAEVVFTAETTDTLTVVAFNTSTGTGAYDLFTAIAPQAFTIPAGDEGGVLSNGALATGTWSIGDIDLYTFSVNDGSSVTLVLSDVSVSSGVSPGIWVFASDGSLVAATVSSNVAQVTFLAESTDTLTAVVLNTGTGLGDYSLLGTGITVLHSDADGLSDALELMVGTSRFVSDTDSDGLSDFEELNYDGDPSAYNAATDLNPLAVDTDGDGVDDATEVLNGTDPLDPGDYLLPGDLNLDGSVNLPDHLLLTRFVLGIGLAPTPEQLVAGDLNMNGQLGAGDLVIHSRMILGIP